MNNIMLTHNDYFPEIPSAPICAGISRRKDHWLRQAIALWLIAQGFSLRVEVQMMVAQYVGADPRSGALRQVISKLRNNGFLKTETLWLRIFSGRRTSFTVVCLSGKGRDLVQDLGWQTHETEWERIQRLHEKGNYQGQHTAAVLAFVYQARLRDWAAGVMPEVDAGWFFPDAVVEKDGKSYYIEVELDELKLSKWNNMAHHQGIIALCALTPEHRKVLLAEAASAAEIHKCTRLSTDLRTMFERDGDNHPLWIEQIKPFR